jgi:hypothetical protein
MEVLKGRTPFADMYTNSISAELKVMNHKTKVYQGHFSILHLRVDNISLPHTCTTRKLSLSVVYNGQIVEWEPYCLVIDSKTVVVYVHCKKSCRFSLPQPGCHSPNSLWLGII